MSRVQGKVGEKRALDKARLTFQEFAMLNWYAQAKIGYALRVD